MGLTSPDPGACLDFSGLLERRGAPLFLELKRFRLYQEKDSSRGVSYVR